METFKAFILLLILNIRESLMLTFENKTKATNTGSGNSTSERYKSWACWERNWFRMKWKWVCYITGCNNTLKSEQFFFLLLFLTCNVQELAKIVFVISLKAKERQRWKEIFMEITQELHYCRCMPTSQS